MYKQIEVKEVPEINEWLFPKTTVILISGKAGVGKTTAAKLIYNYLTSKVTTYVILTNFAWGVKKVAAIMNWNRKKDVKGRKLLQDIGNLGREYDEDAWVDFMIKELQKGVPEELIDIIIVDDWRFLNEANYFFKNRGYKIFTININSPEREFLKGTEECEDISETSLDNYKNFNYIIENKDSFEVFEYDVINVLLDIIEESKQGGKI